MINKYFAIIENEIFVGTSQSQFHNQADIDYAITEDLSNTLIECSEDITTYTHKWDKSKQKLVKLQGAIERDVAPWEKRIK